MSWEIQRTQNSQNYLFLVKITLKKLEDLHDLISTLTIKL